MAGNGVMHETITNAPSCSAKPERVLLSSLFLTFLRLGLTAFGGPGMVAYIRQVAVEKKRWLDANSFKEGVALCQAIPGATAMQAAAFVGLRAGGVAGAAAGFIGFGLPAFVFMLALSALYAQTHNLPAIASAFAGLQAIIVALVANATVTFGRDSLKGWQRVIIAIVAAALFAWETSPILVVVIAGVLALLLIPASPGKAGVAPASPPMPHTRRSVIAILAAGTLVSLGLWFVRRDLFDLAMLMARIDLFAFGGGFSSVPLMFHETVEVRHWLDGATLLNGIVLGQVTPGPIVITATFIGYLLAGITGAVTATVAVFSPSFLVLVATAPYLDRLRSSALFHKVINGIFCSFVGLLLTVTVRFSQGVIWNWLHILLAVAAFVALRLKVNILWIVLVGAGLSIIMK